MVNAFPILIDLQPPYLRGRADSSSLLRLPCGHQSLQESLAAELAALTPHPCAVIPLGAAGVRALSSETATPPGVPEVLSADMFGDPLSRYAPSDVLLLVASRFVPAGAGMLRQFLERASSSPYAVRHLLAIDSADSSTKEYVHSASDGGVRRIQRYFEPTAWPFTVGVIASLVPVASLLARPYSPIASLEALRSSFSESGIPAVDERYEGHVFDLFDESGALAMSEQQALDLQRGQDAPRDRARLGRTETATVHPTARLLGPVVLGAGTVVEAEAMIVGPTVVGRNAHIGRGARVAQCLLAEGSVVAAGQSVRHRVVAHATALGAADEARAPQRRNGNPAAPIQPAIDDRASPRLNYVEVKSWVEVPIALLALVFLSPVLLVIAVLVKLTSPGPIFYGAKREGLGGRSFNCWKFRSMRVNADAQQRALAAAQFADGPQFKMAKDPRITPIGHRIRSWNLDELPQLANVVMRQMSFVGPRPSPFEENQICVPWREGRLSVRPGITGLWQVCRHDRAEGDFHQWIMYDLLYVKHASFMVDVRIFLATILTGGGRRAAKLSRVIPDAVTEPVEAMVAEELATAGQAGPPATVVGGAMTPPPGLRAATKRRNEHVERR